MTDKDKLMKLLKDFGVGYHFCPVFGAVVCTM